MSADFYCRQCQRTLGARCPVIGHETEEACYQTAPTRRAVGSRVVVAQLAADGRSLVHLVKQEGR